MPMVGGQEFPYTPEGRSQAQAARSGPAGAPPGNPAGGESVEVAGQAVSPDVGALLQQLMSLMGGQAGGALGDVDLQRLLPLMRMMLKQQGGGGPSLPARPSPAGMGPQAPGGRPLV